MTKHKRFLALAIAMIANSAALLTINAGMGQITEQERARLGTPERIVVTASRNGNYRLAANACQASPLL